MSSSLAELAPERRMIRDLLTELGWASWLFEHDAGARPTSIRETYVQELERSDVYLGVFWRRAGHYTKDEFLHATHIGLPCLIYVKQAEAHGRSEDLVRLLNTLDNVRGKSTARWFNDIGELRLSLPEDLARVGRLYPRIVSSVASVASVPGAGSRFDFVETGTPMPRHPDAVLSPRPPRHPLVGRHVELAEIESLVQSERAVVGLRGPDGIGKSTILSAVGSQGERPAFDYPAVGVDGAHVQDYADLLRLLWRELYFVAETNYQPHLADIRRYLSHVSALFLVDDVALDSNEVAKLAAYTRASSFVVAQTGTVDGIDRYRVIEVQGLPDPADRLSLFERHLERPVPQGLGPRVDLLLQSTGGVPGVIIFLANQARLHGLDQLLPREHAPKTWLSLILRKRTSAKSREVLAMLGLWETRLWMPADIFRGLAEPDGLDWGGVEELVERRDGFFRLLPGLAAHVAELVPRQAALQALAERTLRWIPEAEPAALDRAGVFLTNLAFEAARVPELHTSVLPIARAAGPQMLRAGSWSAWRRLAELVDAIGGRIGDAEAQGWAANELGAYSILEGELDDAREHFSRALRLRRDLPDGFGAARTRHNLSRLSLVVGEDEPPTGDGDSNRRRQDRRSRHAAPVSPGFWHRIRRLLLWVLIIGSAAGALFLAEALVDDVPGSDSLDFGSVAAGGRYLGFLTMEAADGDAVRELELVGDAAFCLPSLDSESCSLSDASVVAGDSSAPLCDVERSAPRRGVLVSQVICRLAVVLVAAADSDEPSVSVTGTIIGPNGRRVELLGLIFALPTSTTSASATGDDTQPDPGGSVPSTTDTTNVVNREPIAVADGANVDEEGSVTIDVVRNDEDADGDQLTIIGASGASHGSVRVNGNSIDYVHDGSETNADSFTYTIGDGEGASASAVVEIRIEAVNDPPIGQPDSFVAAESTRTELDVGVNDSDVEGDALTIRLGRAPAHGQVTIENGLRIIYFHVGPGVDSDALSYYLSDGDVEVEVDVTLRLDAPPVPTTPEQCYLNFNEAAVYALTADDADSDSLEFRIVEAPEGSEVGQVESSGMSATFEYTPGPNANDPVVYSVSDGVSESRGELTLRSCIR